MPAQPSRGRRSMHADIAFDICNATCAMPQDAEQQRGFKIEKLETHVVGALALTERLAMRRAAQTRCTSSSGQARAILDAC